MHAERQREAAFLVRFRITQAQFRHGVANVGLEFEAERASSLSLTNGSIESQERVMAPHPSSEADC
jgi:hypothetical protein